MVDDEILGIFYNEMDANDMRDGCLPTCQGYQIDIEEHNTLA